MKHSSVELNDLPDEILMIILKKLSNVQVLYSLIGVNKRLHAIVHDPIFTNCLTLMNYVSVDSTDPLSGPVLDQYCLQILPSIHHKIKWLNLESSSMKRILLATNYPNLYGLGLYDIEIETALSFFIDKNQILELVVKHTTYGEVNLTKDMNSRILAHIFTTFSNLQYLNFCASSIWSGQLSFVDPYPDLYLSNQIYLPSKEDIQHTFKDFKDDQVISYIDYFQKEQYSLCHIYSYSFKLKYYHTITNNFPGGLFKYVHELLFYDERPFEHEFFLQSAQWFPFIKHLSIKNSKPQNNKLCKESKNGNQDFSIIKFPHLISLTLYLAHDDYIEEFLIDTRTCLPNNAVHLNIFYHQLKRVTHHFTRDTTRINCAKLNSLCFGGRRLPKYAKDYFPHV
ncbi:unnamed protein product [Rotaria sp. Silwood1]|nr:unnamed protein product [Rotaria sp. Silwood1]CAF4997088.1 unnamed protein product [Rotaria sp. Silwood1]